MNQQTPQINWSKAPEGTTHYNPNAQIVIWYRKTESEWLSWNPSTLSWVTSHASRRELESFQALIPRLQRFDKRRLAERTVMLGTDHSICWLNAGTEVKVGGYVQFDPHWGEVVTIHWDSPDDVGYVTTIVADKLLPLETPEEREAREHFQAMCTVLGWDPMPASYNAEVLHKLYAAGCRMPLDKTKE